MSFGNTFIRAELDIKGFTKNERIIEEEKLLEEMQRDSNALYKFAKHKN